MMTKSNIDIIKLKNSLIGKRIIDWTNSTIELSNGTILFINKIYHSESAKAIGVFSDIILDKNITNIKVTYYKEIGDRFSEEGYRKISISILHNFESIGNIDMFVGLNEYYFSKIILTMKDVDIEKSIESDLFIFET